MFLAYSSVAFFSAFLGFLVCLTASHKIFGKSFWAAELSVLKQQSRELFHYIKSTWLSGSSLIVAGQGDEFILGTVVSPTAVGIYRVTKNFGRLALGLSDSFSEVIYPQFSRLWATKSFQTIREIVLSILRGGIVFSVIAIGLSIAVGSQIIAIIYGQQYTPGGLLIGLIMLNALYIPFLWCGPLFRVSGHIHIALRLDITVSILSLALMVVLTPYWGIYGAAIGIVSHSVVYSIIAAIYFSQKRKYYFDTGRPSV
jgi:O-antigen/teichoic acid export membrane protein